MRLALTTHERGYATLSVYDLSRNILTPIRRREATTRAAVWSPDSRTLYYAVENPVFDIFRRAADAGEPEARVLSSGSDKLPSGVTPDGRAVLFADISFSRLLFARPPVSDQDTLVPVGPRLVVVVNWLATIRERFSQRAAR